MTFEAKDNRITKSLGEDVKEVKKKQEKRKRKSRRGRVVKGVWRKEEGKNSKELKRNVEESTMMRKLFGNGDMRFIPRARRVRRHLLVRTFLFIA